MHSHKPRTRAVLIAATMLSASFLASGHSSGSSDQPFPYDPLCRWGRLSDGKGFLVRCLTEQDVERLKAPAPAEPRPEPDAPPRVPLEVVLGPIEADMGRFPKGVESLDKGQPKYQACMAEHGGISGAEGRVEVRFLVRGRGRAEGAVVKKFSGLSERAAKCIADVVDRRFVGYPEQEPVGATLVVTVKKRTQ
jgi:hypothetical protein